MHRQGGRVARALRRGDGAAGGALDQRQPAGDRLSVPTHGQGGAVKVLLYDKCFIGITCLQILNYLRLLSNKKYPQR